MFIYLFMALQEIWRNFLIIQFGSNTIKLDRILNLKHSTSAANININATPNPRTTTKH